MRWPRGTQDMFPTLPATRAMVPAPNSLLGHDLLPDPDRDITRTNENFLVAGSGPNADLLDRSVPLCTLKAVLPANKAS